MTRYADLWIDARIEHVRLLRALPDDDERPVPGWRRRLDEALPVRADLLYELDQSVTP